jgi:hypothetical protein
MKVRCDLFVPINRDTQSFDLWHYVQCDKEIHHEGSLCRAARLINNAVVQVETCGLPEGSY